MEGAKWFVEQAQKLPGIERIALIGSLCTNKPNPKDVDLLVTIQPGIDIIPLATLGRKLAGKTQQKNHGADVFLVEDGKFIGRTCHFRECHPRVHCYCAFGRPYVCAIGPDFLLPDTVVKNPPLVLWPSLIVSPNLPEDVKEILCEQVGSIR